MRQNKTDNSPDYRKRRRWTALAALVFFTLFVVMEVYARKNNIQAFASPTDAFVFLGAFCLLGAIGCRYDRLAGNDANRRRVVVAATAFYAFMGPACAEGLPIPQPWSGPFFLWLLGTQILSFCWCYYDNRARGVPMSTAAIVLTAIFGPLALYGYAWQRDQAQHLVRGGGGGPILFGALMCFTTLSTSNIAHWAAGK